MTIYTSGTQLGARSSSGIFTAGTRYGEGNVGAPGIQPMKFEYHAKYKSVWGGGSCTVTSVDYRSWRIEGAYSYWADVVFKVTVLSGSYGNTSIDAEVECYAGDDGTSCIHMMSSDSASHASHLPTLTDNTTATFGIAPGETKWIDGAGSKAYQAGYFIIRTSDLGAGSCTGTSSNIYLRIKRLRWGAAVPWDYTNEGIQTSNVKYG